MRLVARYCSCSQFAAIKDVAEFVGSTLSDAELCCIANENSRDMGSHTTSRKDRGKVTTRFGKWKVRPTALLPHGEGISISHPGDVRKKSTRPSVVSMHAFVGLPETLGPQLDIGCLSCAVQCSAAYRVNATLRLGEGTPPYWPLEAWVEVYLGHWFLVSLGAACR